MIIYMCYSLWIVVLFEINKGFCIWLYMVYVIKVKSRNIDKNEIEIGKCRWFDRSFVGIESELLFKRM